MMSCQQHVGPCPGRRHCPHCMINEMPMTRRADEQKPTPQASKRSPRASDHLRDCPTKGDRHEHASPPEPSECAERQHDRVSQKGAGATDDDEETRETQNKQTIKRSKHAQAIKHFGTATDWGIRPPTMRTSHRCVRWLPTSNQSWADEDRNYAASASAGPARQPHQPAAKPRSRAASPSKSNPAAPRQGSRTGSATARTPSREKRRPADQQLSQLHSKGRRSFHVIVDSWPWPAAAAPGPK